MERHDHDPSSSLEGNRLTRRGVLAGVVGGATMLIVGCGKDRMAVPPDYSTRSASPSESPSTSPSPSETVDPEVAARMRAREEYEEQVKKIDEIPYDEFIKLPPEERNKILQAEINYMEKSGRAKDKTDHILYPKDSLPFGDYYKKSPADQDPKKMLTDPFLAVQFALYGRFTYTDDDIKQNYEDYAKKLVSEA